VLKTDYHKNQWVRSFDRLFLKLSKAGILRIQGEYEKKIIRFGWGYFFVESLLEEFPLYT
jgi:hypothetical protein